MVYDGGTLVGIVSPSDVARLFHGGPGRLAARAAA
jgi:hypothetical protein